MKYYIKRELSEFGPYTLADVQRYVAQGNILLTDLTRSEAMTDWVPVSQVIGNIPIPVAAPPMQNAGVPAGMGAPYAGQGPLLGGAPAVAPTAGPTPPDFHWGAVLGLGIVTCGLFWWAWLIVEAVFVRRIDRESKGLLFVILSFASYFLGGFINGFDRAMNPGDISHYGTPFSFIGLVLFIIAEFQLKSDLEDYYNTYEPIHLRLSGVMTFFFAVWYFQHHLSRISQWKKTGVLQPQS